MGSCVLVMLMKDEDVYILNVGDSRAVIAQDCRRGSFNSLSKFSRCQLNGFSVDEHERIGARDSLLRQELERIIEETPTEIEALETHDPCLGPPPPGLSVLGALQLTSDHSTSTEEVTNNNFSLVVVLSFHTKRLTRTVLSYRKCRG